ncbi:hypothetical protein KR222_002704 [Zaprionus bogoriensis]|nr:hypothetical protein KR222_002704 [Zaprionus bogoriensis]
MSAIPQNDLWLDFFRLYRQLPALWKVMDEVYKNKRLKKLAYEKLLLCYQKIDPTANVDSMRRRMNGIRTCYRRELRKVEHSESISKCADDVYVPHLWYFNELFFLRGHEVRTPNGADNADNTTDCWAKEHEEEEAPEESTDNWEENSEHETKVNFEQILSEPEQSPVRLAAEDQPMPQQIPPMNQSSYLPHLMQSINPINARDEAAVYAEGWAISYRKLDERNRLLAKKAIEEILVLGQLNKLEFNSVKMS